jgi:hypothetical protein
MTDYTILHAPRIALRTFAAVLVRAGSPARGAAADAYRSAVAYGVDPAVLLAIFCHESGYGRAGVATRNRSWGNERRAPGYPTVDGFARFPTWEAGAHNTARLLRVYGKSDIRPGTDTSTVRKLPYVWAPAGDGGNRPASYGDALVRSIRGYLALDATLAGAPVHPTHVTPFEGSRLRAKASTSSAIVRELHSGARARVAATVEGGRYRLPDGRTGTRWHRITALGGDPLPSPVYSAALLWRAL